ncbi:MFS transporter [Aeromicrobium sp.]|uniref:MFS transporter n=1 Tax=Aeromicrobium sp. TaxID=1871063 RepID=UPI0019AF1CC6|nr:MFS transporter [Aeromicrobium sp.]MBC7632552.1 MFS transporter [Aeromicrobium sp.]
MGRTKDGALGNRFFVLLTSSASSNLADGIVKTALPLIAVRWTDSPVLVSGIVTAAALPWLLFALPAGLLVDKLDRRRSMLVANTLRALTLLIVAAMIVTGGESVWSLYVAAFALGCAETVHDTAAQSLLPGVVHNSLLERANGRLSAAEVTTNTFIGPLLGAFLVASGVVLGVVGPAGLWALAVVVLLALRVERTPHAQEQQPRRSELASGIRFVWSNLLLRSMALMVGVVNLSTSAFLATFVVYAVGPTSTLQASEVQYGVFLAAAGAGSLLGALGASRAAAAIGRGRLLAATLLGVALFIAAPSITEILPLLLMTFFVGGAAVASWNVITISFRQRISPDHLLGRVNSFYRLLTWGTIPLGALLGGIGGELVGLEMMFAIAAVIAALPLIGIAWVNETNMSHEEGQD